VTAQVNGHGEVHVVHHFGQHSHCARNLRHNNPFPATLGGGHYDDYQWSYEVRSLADQLLKNAGKPVDTVPGAPVSSRYAMLPFAVRGRATRRRCLSRRI
jgi:hypothetical protein